jgi:hypothetical protein
MAFSGLTTELCYEEEMVREKKGKMTAVMRTVIKKAIRA